MPAFFCTYYNIIHFRYLRALNQTPKSLFKTSKYMHCAVIALFRAVFLVFVISSPYFEIYLLHKILLNEYNTLFRWQILPPATIKDK